MSDKQRYLYHYCGLKRDGAVETHIDGLLLCESPIDSMIRYYEVKAEICKDLESARITLINLSFLGMSDQTDLYAASGANA